jgi:hypothetical protein
LLRRGQERRRGGAHQGAGGELRQRRDRRLLRLRRRGGRLARLRRLRDDRLLVRRGRTVELEPTQREALTLLAETYAEELQPKLAREFAERALALDPPVGERPRLLELAGREPEEVFVDAEAEAEAATGDPAQQ